VFVVLIPVKLDISYQVLEFYTEYLLQIKSYHGNREIFLSQKIQHGKG